LRHGQGYRTPRVGGGAVEQWWNDNMKRNSEETQTMAHSPPLMSHEYTNEAQWRESSV